MRALIRLLPSTRREEKHDDEHNMIDDYFNDKSTLAETDFSLIFQLILHVFLISLQ